MNIPEVDLLVLYEHPEWQKPLFEELKTQDIVFETFDLKRNFFSDEIFENLPDAKLYFNQASPSAYTRGNGPAIPFNLALLEYLEINRKNVINGLQAFRFELSKMTQIAVMQQLKIPYPKTIAFNNVTSLKSKFVNKSFTFPAVLKPNLGGSGARMFHVQSFGAVVNLLRSKPEIWDPDNLLLLQEYLKPKSESEGVVRLEYLDGNFLYGMRVVSNGNFNLCPSDYCNPSNEINFDLEDNKKNKNVEFFPYSGVPTEMIRIGEELMKAGRLDLGAIEYLETDNGRNVVYDINANSNLRRSIGEYFGFNPFKKVVDYLEQQITKIDHDKKNLRSLPKN